MDVNRATAGDEAIQARIELLNRHLLSHDTATAALSDWCKSRGLGDGPITTRILGTSVSWTGAHGRGYRRVSLHCGSLMLSAAEIRFRCKALSAEMLRALSETDIPFGAVAAPLGPRRITTLAETAEAGRGVPEDSVLIHHATVVDRNGRPIARVREAYKAVLVR